jgi:Endosomal/lysosomal potassium channel TMEM175
MPLPFSSASREVTRLEGFSDAVFGFAITLLVVSLEVPANFDDLMVAFRGLPVFAITFAMLLLVWHEHHTFFRQFGLQDGVTIWLNGLLLFVVMVYIYPLKFLFAMIAGFTGGGIGPDGLPAGMIRQDQVVPLMVMYGVGFASIFGVLALMYLHAARLERLGAPGTDRDSGSRLDALIGAGHCGVYVLVGLLSIAIAVIGNGPWASGIAGIAYGTIGPFQALYHFVSARWRP